MIDNQKLNKDPRTSKWIGENKYLYFLQKQNLLYSCIFKGIEIKQIKPRINLLTKT